MISRSIGLMTSFDSIVPRPNTENGLANTSDGKESVFVKAWNLLNSVREKKSTEASIGSSVNMLDVLTGDEDEEKEVVQTNTGRAKSVPYNRPLLSSVDYPIKKCSSGINCVLGDDNVKNSDDQLRNEEIGTINLSHDYAELVGQPSDQHPDLILDSEYPATTKKIDLGFSGSKVPTMGDYKLASTLRDTKRSDSHTEVSPSPQIKQSSHVDKEKLNACSVDPRDSMSVTRLSNQQTTTSGDYQRVIYEDTQNQNHSSVTNKNNININLTFAMGQHQNAGKLEIPSDLDHRVEQLKPSCGRTYHRKPKIENSMQTEAIELCPRQQDTVICQFVTDTNSASTSEFPSVTPSNHNVTEGHGASETSVVGIPENKMLAWNEYIDIPAVVAYTGESMRTFLDTTDHIINNFIIMPDVNLFTEEELEAGEKKLGISLMRLLGVPQQLRHNIYNEALHNIQAIGDISTETVSIINHVIDWLCNGDGGGREKIINRFRQLVSVTTDLQPHSEAWNQFESDFCIFTDAVGEVMKQGCEVGKDVARRCSDTIIDNISHQTESALALLAAKVESITNLPGMSARSSSVRVQSSLPSITEESEPTNAEFQTEQDKFSELTEALKKIESEEVINDASSENSGTTALNKSTLEDLKYHFASEGIHHGTNPCEWKRDAFMDAPPPVAENPFTLAINTVCEKLTKSFVGKAEYTVSHFHGSGMTPILGESQCSSRDEPLNEEDPLAGEAELRIKPHMVQHLTVQGLAAEVEKLAALTNSYFIESDSDETYIGFPEPTVECPPPPVPKRKPSTDVSQATTLTNLEMEFGIPQKFDLENSTVNSSSIQTLAKVKDLPSDPSSTPSGTESMSSGASAINSVISTPISSGLGTGITISEETGGISSADLIDLGISPTQRGFNFGNSNHQLDSNCNTTLQERTSLPQMSDFMLKLKPFWPTNAFSKVLAPEAQLQFAMNKFFEANGTKKEIQMSIASLEIPNMSMTGETLTPKKIGNQFQIDEKKLHNDMSNLERIIQNLSTELQGKNRITTAIPSPSLQKPRVEDNATQLLEKFVEPAVNNSKNAREVEVKNTKAAEIKNFKLKSAQTSSVSNPQNMIEVKIDEHMHEVPEIKFNDYKVNLPKGKVGVSPRLTKIPSRFFTVPRLSSGIKKETVRTASAASKTTSKSRTSNFTVGTLLPKCHIPKIKVIDTIPFTQPTKSRIQRHVPNSPFLFNAAVARTALDGAYARQPLTYTPQQRSLVPSRETSTTNLSRTNSYRQMHQMKQLLARGQRIPSATSFNKNPSAASESESDGVGTSSYITRNKMNVREINSLPTTD